MSGDLYNNVVMSLVKFIQDFRGTLSETSEYVDWDAHAQVSELPTENLLIGPAGFGLTEETTGMYEVVFSFGVSTYNDPNLFILRSVTSKLFGKLKVGQTIPIYDADTAEIISSMVIKTPRGITPVSKAEIRSLQFIELVGLLEPYGASSQ